MTEKKRLGKLFSDLYDGSPWIDINFMSSVAGLTADQAASRPVAALHSIWELLNHIIAWRKNVLRRMNGETMRTPAHNYFKPVKNKSAAAWQQTLVELRQSHDEWMKWLLSAKAGIFDETYVANGLTYYEHIHGILQHDAYHLGQINLLRKLI